MVVRHLRKLAAEGALARADDVPAGTDAVRLREGRRLVERRAELPQLLVEVRVEGELLRDDERRDENDARAAVRGEAAGEVERMLRLRPAEERDDDVPVADGDRAAGEASCAPSDRREIRAAHQSSW